MSKMFGTLVFQDIALTTPPENMQIVSFHPGSIWSAAWEAMGLGLKPENFNNGKKTHNTFHLVFSRVSCSRRQLTILSLATL
jgi:hypothetical protein